MSIRAPMVLVAWLLSVLTAANAQNLREARSADAASESIRFDQKLGAALPTQLMFRTAHDADMRFGALLRGRPTVLIPGYYHCSGLCGAVRAGVMQAVTRGGLKPGRDFNVVLFSIDPRDDAKSALAAQQRDTRAFPGAQVSTWWYLTSGEASGSALATALGFRYRFDSGNGQFNHPAGIVLLTPQGHISQYLFGVRFDPQTFRLALVAASHGEIGNVVDRLLLLCSHYDTATGRYTPLIERLLAAFTACGAVLLGAGILFLRRRERRRTVRTP